MTAPLLGLALLFGELSVLAFGGGNSVLPEMQRRMVEVHGWMTAAQFNALFGLAQAAPGPNMMVVTLLGWRLAGFWGALVATVAMFAPSSLITGIALRAWDRFRDTPWRRAVQAGLVPVTAGLVAAGAALIASTAAGTPALAGVVAAAAVLSIATKLHPLWLLGLGAASGLSGMGFG
ncbi:MAG: Chromate transport protein ChrA [uncultured Acetobacteraceae bacterium]|uniref:Chromate transport protein ChrA n=1 Tax=uncultured Acetobacteraceae bacterium TaxID=169975 RepID=A0A6J4IBW7_9PROT|nr:MAG: Chromate transport protein ChrA [uncultured Acetobacteraceae bacterium]